MAKFQFDTSFDLPGPDEREQDDAVPPAPVFDENDIARARAEGAEEGHRAGLAEAAAGMEAQQAAALDAIAAALAEQAPAWRTRLETAHHEALTVARAVIAKTIPEAARENALALIESAIAVVLPKLMDEPRAVIRVSDSLLDDLQAITDRIKKQVGYSGDLILLAESDFGPADCTVEWADGGAEYHQEQIWNDIEEAMNRYFAGADETPSAEIAGETGTADPMNNPEPEETPNG